MSETDRKKRGRTKADNADTPMASRSQSSERQREPAEFRFARELDALANANPGDRPTGWRLTPRAIRDFICGCEQPVDHPDGEKIVIDRKFYGDDSLVERSIVTLATQRGLMLVGEPGTAKSLLSELLSAAISGGSLLAIQGSAATTEDQIRYSWNYALLLAKGPCVEALVPGPLHVGMRTGRLVRFEEITRCPLEVQDVIIPMLSERLLMVPELGDEGTVHAKPGFNLIATANTRDRGVNEMSAALRRRFNFETVQPIPKLADELELVQREVGRQLTELGAEAIVDRDITELLVTTFHELRNGQTMDGAAIAQPSGVLSTADAVAITLSASLHSRFYGKGDLSPEDLVRHLGGVAGAEPDDHKAIRSYFDGTVKARAAGNELWKQYYQARKHLRK